jgi:outer membrane protein assembly factor BamB
MVFNSIMKRLARVTFLAIAIALLMSPMAVVSIAQAVDPAPPTLRSLEKLPDAKPVKHDSVAFFGKPKPLPKGAVTHDWKTFLGPTHNCNSTETKLLKKFPKGGPKIVWELMTGNGYASPGIEGDYLVYPHRVRNETIVECLHPRTGEKYWQYKFDTDYQDRYGYSNGPRCSPIMDGERVYVYSVEGRLTCLKTKTGQVIWERNINQEFKVPQGFFGTASTPFLYHDTLIINVGAPQGPCVVGINKLSGKLVWEAGKNNWGPSYASPIPAKIHGKDRVFVYAGGESDPPSGGLLSIDPKNGRVDFEYPWRSRKYESVNAMCPLIIGNNVFVSASYRCGSSMLSIDKNFKPTVEWTKIDLEHNLADELGIHWSTPVHKDGHIYAFDGRNEGDASLVCVNAKTGKIVWREIPELEEEIEFAGEKQTITMSTLRGSLLVVDGKFLCIGELGHLMWLDLTPQGMKILDRVWMFGSAETWAPPIVSHGLLYVTQNKRDVLTKKLPRLICYDLRANE